MMVKIYMAKAYNVVNWGFLLEVFLAFGFFDNFCRLIGRCMESPSFFVMMNETFKGFFSIISGFAPKESPISIVIYHNGGSSNEITQENFFTRGTLENSIIQLVLQCSHS